MGCLENKIAVITGGSNGIGKCMVSEFRREGAAVAVIDKSDYAPECDYFYHGDIAYENILQDFSEQIKQRYGKIDFLINNACLSRGGIFSCGYEDFLYVQRVGVAAPYLLAKLFCDHFNKEAAIVNISSTRAYQSQPDTESYTAAKGGISALTHALAVSFSGRVRVNSISPGWIDTADSSFSDEDNLQHPSGRVGRPHDIARMAVFLCSAQAGFLTGEDIRIDGGMSHLMIYHNDHGWEMKL